MKEKNDHINLLNTIYQTVQMGIIGIDQVETKVMDENFKKLLKEQREEFKKISDKAIEVYIKYGKEEKDISELTKMTSSIMATIKTNKDQSSSNIAGMMMEGVNKGILEITEKINNYCDDDPELVTLAGDLLKILQKDQEELKAYL